MPSSSRDGSVSTPLSPRCATPVSARSSPSCSPTAGSQRTCSPGPRGSGCTRRAWVESSRLSNAEGAGRVRPRPFPTRWCACRWASRTSTTCGPTSRPLSGSSWVEPVESRLALVALVLGLAGQEALDHLSHGHLPDDDGVHGRHQGCVYIAALGEGEQRAARLHALGDLAGRGGDLLGAHPLAQLLAEGPVA